MKLQFLFQKLKIIQGKNYMYIYTLYGYNYKNFIILLVVCYLGKDNRDMLTIPKADIIKFKVLVDYWNRQYYKYHYVLYGNVNCIVLK